MHVVCTLTEALQTISIIRGGGYMHAVCTHPEALKTIWSYEEKDTCMPCVHTHKGVADHSG